ncbi:DUF2752 domain-containing protein [Streptomyces cacaoi]|uniref:DUF2752 domain-containing protein n=1 Tax=Streptomyces cacaoi TaxID=1898 RepID=UPI0004C795E3
MRHRLSRAVPRLAAPLATLAGAGAAFVYVAAVDPGEPGRYPACPVWTFLGVYCPACGGLRSAHALAHGDLGPALGANAAAVLFFLAFAGFWLHWVVLTARGRPYAPPMRLLARPGSRTAVLWAAAAALAAFTLLRNTPFGSALAP